MSTTTIRFTLKIGGVLTDATSVVLSDPTGAFGLRRTDTNAVVVADGTALTKLSTGTYSYTFTDPAAGLTYQYYVEWVYAGATYRVEKSATSAATSAVTLTEAKAYLRVTDTSSDDEITALIAAAVDYLERRTNLRLLTTQVTAIMDAFPDYLDITLPTAPLVTVDSITYLDSAGATQTLAATEYTVDTSRRPGRVVADDDWPATQDVANAVTITYTAGFAAVPDVLKLAVKMLIAHWYDNRGQATEKAQNEIPLAIGAIIDNHAVRLAQG